MRKLNLSILFLLITAPAYAHHVPGRDSAVVEIFIAGSRVASLTNGNGLSCLQDTVTRNATCTLPPNYSVTGGGATFLITGTTSGTGAKFVVICNASTIAPFPCDKTVQYKFQNTIIKKTNGSTGLQEVQIKIAYTVGLLDSSTLNSAILESVGFTHGFTSKGVFKPASGFVATNNTHKASAAFTYVKSGGTCGTGEPGTEPFNVAGCTQRREIPCSGPATSSANGITCNTSVSTSSDEGIYKIPSSTTLTSFNSITKSGALVLLDSVARLCSNLFGANTTCQAVERDEMTLTYGFYRINDQVTITTSGDGQFGPLLDVLGIQASEKSLCSLHESAAGSEESIPVINANDNGFFKVTVLGSPEVDTSLINCATAILGLPGTESDTWVRATSCSSGKDFNGDEFPDMFITYPSGQALRDAGIDCSLAVENPITVVQEAGGVVAVTGEVVVGGAVKGKSPKKSGEVNFGTSSDSFSTQLRCDMQALVKACNQ